MIPKANSAATPAMIGIAISSRSRDNTRHEAWASLQAFEMRPTGASLGGGRRDDRGVRRRTGPRLRHAGRRIAHGALGGVPLSAVPDKRQTSKQRRAARNRASRDALAARRTNAVTSTTPPASSRASSASSVGAGSGTTASATAGRTGFGGLLGTRGNRRPGDLAVMVALGLAIVSAVSVLFFTKVPVDDRGEPLPRTFQGVAVAAREAITGERMPDRNESLLEASGPGVILYLALPVAVAAFAFWANRRPDRSRLLTFALVAMAGLVLFLGGYFFFPTLVALAVASYQIRKADMPARVAERVAPTRGRRGVIDAESEELTDEPVDDAAEGAIGERSGRTDGPDADAGEGAADDEAGEQAGEEADPLAELEAEMESEEHTRRGRGGDPARGSKPDE
jgi:hypothetical protein